MFKRPIVAMNLKSERLEQDIEDKLRGYEEVKNDACPEARFSHPIDAISASSSLNTSSVLTQQPKHWLCGRGSFCERIRPVGVKTPTGLNVSFDPHRVSWMNSRMAWASAPGWSSGMRV